MFSSKTNLISLPEKFISPGAGIDLFEIISGGEVSLLPPVKAVCCAQLIDNIISK